MAGAAKQSFFSYLRYQFKRGFHLHPEVMGAGCIGTASLIGIILKVVFQKPEVSNRRYKLDYFIMRPDDPRLESVRRYDDSPVETKT